MARGAREDDAGGAGPRLLATRSAATPPKYVSLLSYIIGPALAAPCQGSQGDELICRVPSILQVEGHMFETRTGRMRLLNHCVRRYRL